MARDKYRSFADLLAGEGDQSFGVESLDRKSAFVVIAPHGGSIEPGTSEVARNVAGSELSFYCFEGRKAAGNRDLHITSTNFDEPSGVALVTSADVAIAVHGEGNVDEPVAYLGGLNQQLCGAIKGELLAAGFDVRTHESPELQGLHSQNICNRGRSGAGVQLELSKALRLQFFPALTREGRAAPKARFFEFASALRRALGLPPIA